MVFQSMVENEAHVKHEFRPRLDYLVVPGNYESRFKQGFLRISP